MLVGPSLCKTAVHAWPVLYHCSSHDVTTPTIQSVSRYQQLGNQCTVCTSDNSPSWQLSVAASPSTLRPNKVPDRAAVRTIATGGPGRAGCWVCPAAPANHPMDHCSAAAASNVAFYGTEGASPHSHPQTKPNQFILTKQYSTHATRGFPHTLNVQLSHRTTLHAPA